MQDFRKKRRNSIYIRFFILVLVCFNVLIVVSLVDLVKKNREAKARKNVALQELSRLTEREENITRKIEIINTPFGTEEAIREKFAFKKPGEGEVIITKWAEEEADASQKSGGFWEFLKNIFR
ncbi:MAG TPA: hypothetical protein VJ103_00290 [Candidatus Paceibacterota bacterium]|nr:hypothetical protein [Candidatus Paceibacterota bacterium]